MSAIRSMRKNFCHILSCPNESAFRVWLFADCSDMINACGLHLTSAVRKTQGSREPSVYHVTVRTIR